MTAAAMAELDRAWQPKISGHLAAVPKPLAIVEYAQAQAPEHSAFLVKGLLTRGDLSCWFGPPKSGKTFVALDLALHIATGAQWRGRRVRPGRVVYLAAEAGRSVLTRIAAARQKFGDVADFAVVVSPINLLRADADLPRVLELLQARAPVDLLVLDTLSRAMPGGDENSAEAMTALIGNLDRIRADTGAHCLVVHHCGKEQARGMRGHSSLLAAVDLAVEVAQRTIRVDAARDLAGGGTWSFDLEAVEVGRDEDGEAIVSCIVRDVDECGAPSKPDRPTGKNQRLALDALTAAILDKGALAPPSRDVPSHVRGVPLDSWRDYFDRYMPELNPKHRASRFREVSASLCDSGHARHVAGFVWVP